MGEYFCPNCNADLDDQYGFNPDLGVWTCTNCGELLYGDDIADTMDTFDGVVWFCDSCGAILNKQPGFYDYCDTWECTECGYENSISDDNIINPSSSTSSISRVDWIDDDVRDYYIRYYENQRKQRIERLKQDYKGILFTIITVLLGTFGIFRYWEYTKRIPVGIDAADIVGVDCSRVCEILEAAGFNKIYTEADNDLSFEELDKENIICNVSINGDSEFDKNAKYPDDSIILLTFHSSKLLSVPVITEEATKLQYEEVSRMFKEAGFGDVSVKPDYDILTGWINDEGRVEKITINGNSEVTVEERYRTDAQVIITYHDLFKNKPK